MKNIYLILLIALLFGCSKDNKVDSSTIVSLSQLSATNYPETNNTWIIDNSTATIDDFDGLREALIDADSNGRKISLEFPNLSTIPDCYEEVENSGISNISSIYSVSAPLVETVGFAAFCGCTSITNVYMPKAKKLRCFAFQDCDALTSVDFPEVTDIEENAISYCDLLSSIDLPKAVLFGQGAFWGNVSLVTLSIATETGSKLTSVYNDILRDTNQNGITLYLGEDNSEYVLENTLTFDEFSETFKDVIIVTF